MLRRLGDRGEGSISYLAVILLVASIVAAVTVVAIPDKVTGGISWAVCRVTGAADCERPGGGGSGRPGDGHPSGGGPSAGAGDTTSPAASAPAVPNLPGTAEQQAYDQAKQRADAAGAKNSDLATQVKDAGVELLKFLSELIGIEDAKKCVLEGDIAACLWTLVGIMPWGKAFKLLKKIPAAVKLGKRLKELWDAIAAARKEKEAADAALKEAERALAKRRAEEALALCKKRNSFAAGTRVLLADGRRRRIEDVRAGDAVWATDPEEGRSGPGTVTELISGSGVKHLVDLTIDTDGLPGGPSVHVQATDGHRFWSPDLHSWVEAKNLTAGDRLGTANAVTASVSHIRHYARRERVFNLSVGVLHTYYVEVGGTPVLVHNDPPCFGVGDTPRKVVNSNMGHIDEERAARAGFDDVQSAQAAVRDLGKSIETNGFPEGTITDTAHADRLLVPIGRNGYAVYQIKNNGNAVFKTILTAR